jgi:chitinase
VIDADVGAGDKLGVFERLHVRFYGEARCGYDYHETRPFWGAWHTWVSTFPAARLLVGLPAAAVEMRGWIDPATLRDSVLPSVRDDPNYGGVMLWDRYHDKVTGSGRAIDP